MDLKGSKTEKNLLAAFSGESQARNKYTYFAKKARQEGYEQIGALFEETAENEKEHAKLEFKYLNGIGTTIENLKTAAAGEHYEWTDMYPSFAKIAREEGFLDIAKTFEEITKVETAHEARYQKLLKNIEGGKVFKKDASVKWKCRQCGYVYDGAQAPDNCPACKHAQSYFELHIESY